MDKIQTEDRDAGDPPSYEAAPPPYALDDAAEDHAGQPSSPGHRTAYQAASDIVQPGIFVLSGQQIYATSNPTLSLYELNRGITNLGHATSVIEFSRVEQRKGSSDSPHVTRRVPRHIYNLHHFRSSSLSNPSQYADCFVKAVAAPSRRLGHLGLKTPRGLTSPVAHWTAAPIDMKTSTEWSRPRFIADVAGLWEAQYKKGVCKWNDMAGNDVAIEYETEHMQQPQLVITAALERGHLDALVALWCCRVWQQRLLGQPLHVVPPQHSTSGIHRKLFQ